MVIAAARPEVSALPAQLPRSHRPQEPRSPRPPKPLTHCYRCGTRLVMGYDEPECMSCGWVDYSYTDPSVSSNGASIISAATRYVLRYCGDFANLAETLVYARAVRIRNRVAYAVNCPVLRQVMEQSVPVGQAARRAEQRYKCSDGHRISLVPPSGACSAGVSHSGTTFGRPPAASPTVLAGSAQGRRRATAGRPSSLCTPALAGSLMHRGVIRK